MGRQPGGRNRSGSDRMFEKPSAAGGSITPNRCARRPANAPNIQMSAVNILGIGYNSSTSNLRRKFHNVDFFLRKLRRDLWYIFYYHKDLLPNHIGIFLHRPLFGLYYMHRLLGKLSLLRPN